jgi:hypothetical protein
MDEIILIMGRSSRLLAVIGMGVALVSFAIAQNTAPTHTAVPSKRYCHPNDGFCFRYPGTWLMLGDVFAGNGVVVAPQQKEQDRILWDAITVAMVAPAPEGDDEGPGLNGIVEQASSAMREAGQNFATLQRQERTVDHKPAQLLKVQYKEKASGRDWIEELVFIQGPENEIYSVALKCAPQDVTKLEPGFAEVLRTWTLPQAEPGEEEGAETPPAKAPAAPPAHHW